MCSHSCCVALAMQGGGLIWYSEIASDWSYGLQIGGECVPADLAWPCYMASTGGRHLLPHFQIFRNTQAPHSTLNSIPWAWNICRGPSFGCLQVRLELSLDQEQGECNGWHIVLILVCLWNSRAYIFHVPWCLYWTTLFIHLSANVSILNFREAEPCKRFEIFPK